MTAKQAIEQVMQITQDAMRQTLRAQGHYNTGKLSESIVYSVTVKGESISGIIEGPDYAVYLDTGVPASRIPYSGRTGRGGTSQYIQGLIVYFKDRGLPTKEAKNAAFATAAKHKREGMPTTASARFSSTGKRTGFIRESVEDTQKKITDSLENSFRELIIFEFGEAMGALEYIEFTA